MCCVALCHSLRHCLYATRERYSFVLFVSDVTWSTSQGRHHNQQHARIITLLYKHSEKYNCCNIHFYKINCT